MASSRELLKRFCADCVAHLNAQAIQTKIGRHNLELSTRTLSDLVEKLTIDYIIDYFGEDKVSYKSWQGYDVIIITLQETLYVNIKTNEHNENLDGTWLCSASVISKLEQQGILAHLYCTKFEYLKRDRETLEFLSGKLAGPVSSIKLIYHTKGQLSEYRIRTEYNGTHCQPIISQV